MPESLQIASSEAPQPARPGRSWIAWMGAGTILIALVALMWPVSERRSSSRQREAHLPFGAAEQAYVPNLRIENLTLSRAENFLNQEITTLAGRVTNTGSTPVSNVEITVEFADELGQIVLRESRTLFASQASPLTPNEQRGFEVSFEHIPPSWNQQTAVRVTGILFAGKE